MAKRQDPWMKAYDAGRLPVETALKEIRQVITKTGHITHAQFMARMRLRSKAQLLYTMRHTARLNARAEEATKKSAIKKQPEARA